MTSVTEHDSDRRIERAVARELAVALHVVDAHVGVSLLNGIVTLDGGVDAHTSRIDAASATLRVSGVTVVVNEIVVRSSTTVTQIAADIAVSIKHVLDWSVDLSQGKVQVEIRDNVVILTGVVTWDYQRRAAASVIRGLVGALQIDNLIELTPLVAVHTPVDRKDFALNVADHHTGRVHTWVDTYVAGHTGWSLPRIGALHIKLGARRQTGHAGRRDALDQTTGRAHLATPG